MKDYKNLLDIDLQLFDEATAGAQIEGARDISVGEDTKALDATEQRSEDKDNAHDDNVEESFEELIKGKYKADFDKRVHQIINKRFGDTKRLEAKIDSYQPLIDILSSRYNVKDGSVSGILEAIKSDNKFYEDAAEKLGIPVEVYRDMAEKESENKRLRNAIEMAEAERNARERYERLKVESAALKEDYSDFDLDFEWDNNEMFADLIRNGVDVRTAYEVTHMDDIKLNMVKNTAKATAQKIVNRQSRPMENGMSGQASTTTKADVSKLTRQQMLELIKRAQNGEFIEL